MSDIAEIVAAPLNNMAIQLLKLVLISLLAYGTVYLIVKKLSTFHVLVKGLERVLLLMDMSTMSI